MRIPQQDPEAVRTLRVAGCGLRGTGYPNAWNTVRLLAQQKQLHLIDCAHWLPDDFHLWKMVKGSLRDKLRGGWLLASRTLSSSLRLAASHRRGDYLYLPYPSLPMLWLLSWLPTKLRPTCIADAYITLWDTLFQDRQLGKPKSRLSRWLLAAESRALRAASTIIVDTQANADHLSTLFGVPYQRIHAFPLAIDPRTLPTPSNTTRRTSNKVRVLFIGTFVPLQGTTVIAKAIAQLADRDDLEFVLIGDGQQADEAAQLLDGWINVTWLRGWQPPRVLATELARADICLGVFGGEYKASRVLPFKLYLALAAGKAVITQPAYSLPDGCPVVPVLSCTAEPQGLAEAIIQLAGSTQQRNALSRQAQLYFQQHLSAKRLSERWQQLLVTVSTH